MPLSSPNKNGAEAPPKLLPGNNDARIFRNQYRATVQSGETRSGYAFDVVEGVRHDQRSALLGGCCHYLWTLTSWERQFAVHQFNRTISPEQVSRCGIFVENGDCCATCRISINVCIWTAGDIGISNRENLSSLKGQGQALNQYYNSQQYKDLADQARYQSLAAAEATGGLGSTATSNQLATIAPTLGQQWLSGQMNNYNNLANIGLGALQGQANAGQTYANNMSQISQQSAALAAANANRPSALQQGVSGAASGALLGGGIASALELSTPWGAAIGGGLGLLGSLF